MTILGVLLSILPADDFRAAPVCDHPRLMLYLSPKEDVSETARGMLALPEVAPLLDRYRVVIVEDWQARGRAGVRETPCWRVIGLDGCRKGEKVRPDAGVLVKWLREGK